MPLTTSIWSKLLCLLQGPSYVLSVLESHQPCPNLPPPSSCTVSFSSQEEAELRAAGGRAEGSREQPDVSPSRWYGPRLTQPSQPTHLLGPRYPFLSLLPPACEPVLPLIRARRQQPLYHPAHGQPSSLTTHLQGPLCLVIERRAEGKCSPVLCHSGREAWLGKVTKASAGHGQNRSQLGHLGSTRREGGGRKKCSIF